MSEASLKGGGQEARHTNLPGAHARAQRARKIRLARRAKPMNGRSDGPGQDARSNYSLSYGSSGIV